MPYRVTLIPGDGIGPEVTEAARRVLEATGVEINWDIGVVGEKAQPQFGTPLPDNVLASIKRNRLALKGPVATPIGTGFRSVNVAIRKSLDLYACVRPCKIYRGAPTSFKNVDIVVVRESTEDLYTGIEFAKDTADAKKLIDLIQSSYGTKVNKDSGFSIKMLSESGSRRIVKFAFEYARANNRKKVTAGHKANILKFSDGLFLNVAREVAKDYPDIEFEDVVIDALCMHLVRNPQSFNVIVLPNLYGDIVSDLCAGLVGGLGLAPGANIGDDIAVFEPTHGSAPKYTGQNKVNPMAMMLSGVMMLRHLREKGAADRVEKAIADVIAEGKSVTYDLKSKQNQSPAGTMQVADAVIKKIKEDCLVTKNN
ncbi:isocitrate/isopropylmalate dehydrogenase family protein [Chloroflexota bacterium]